MVFAIFIIIYVCTLVLLNEARAHDMLIKVQFPFKRKNNKKRHTLRIRNIFYAFALHCAFYGARIYGVPNIRKIQISVFFKPFLVATIQLEICIFKF